MTKQEFINDIANLLETEETLTETTDLSQLDEFDSLAIMGFVALISSKFGKTIPGQVLSKVKTIQDLIDLIGKENFYE